KVRFHYVTFDEGSNTVHVNAPANRLAQCRLVLSKIDIPSQPGAAKYKATPPVLKQYTVANADQTIKWLKDFHKNMTAQMFAIGQTQLLVYGRLDEHVTI